MSIKPIINNTNALGNKSLNIFANTVTTNALTVNGIPYVPYEPPILASGSYVPIVTASEGVLNITAGTFLWSLNGSVCQFSGYVNLEPPVGPLFSITINIPTGYWVSGAAQNLIGVAGIIGQFGLLSVSSTSETLLTVKLEMVSANGAPTLTDNYTVYITGSFEMIAIP